MCLAGFLQLREADAEYAGVSHRAWGERRACSRHCLPYAGAAETAAGHADDGRKGRRKVNYRAENIRLAGLAEV